MEGASFFIKHIKWEGESPSHCACFALHIYFKSGQECKELTLLLMKPWAFYNETAKILIISSYSFNLLSKKWNNMFLQRWG